MGGTQNLAMLLQAPHNLFTFIAILSNLCSPYYLNAKYTIQDERSGERNPEWKCIACSIQDNQHAV